MRLLRYLGVTAIILTCSFAFLLWWNFFPVTMLWRYGGVIHSLKQNSQALNFPDQIPASATNVKFSYQPGFLQGATMVRLQFTIPESEFIELKQNISATHPTLKSEDLHRVLPLFLPYEWMKDNKYKYTNPSTLYTSFLISPDLPTAKRNWNHPFNEGVSFSKSGHEVLYWYN